MQIWPALRNERRVAPATAASRSARPVTTSGQFPPSSIDVGLTPCTVFMMAAPVSPEPVKATLFIAGCATRARPAAPEPVTRFATPAGMPAASRQRNSSIADEGVYSDGLTTIVQPAPSEAASFHPINSSG